MNEKYEPIKFDSWQELAKYVIDGGEVYYEGEKIIFDDDYSQFNYQFTEHLMSNTFTKKQSTLEELIAIKPRLCWVWDETKTNKSMNVVYRYNKNNYYPYLLWNNVGFVNAQMLTDDEIKQFLSDGE